MRTLKTLPLAAVVLGSLCSPSLSVAKQATPDNVVEARARDEHKLSWNPFAVTLYKPNYILPFFYSHSPNDKNLGDIIPNNQGLNSTEVKFQFSIKFPLWEKVLNSPFSFYAGYTQNSYWQAYSDSAFFRETNYEPEIMVQYDANYKIARDWELKFVNLSFSHQSNGRGGDIERSWNRLYLDAVFSNTNWMITISPWIVLPEKSLHQYNPDIEHYLGHGKVLVAYKYHDHVFAVESRNNLESAFQRGAVQVTWSFPMFNKVKGYIQFFNGYGQNLIDYNHRSNSIGIGIALNDWI